MATHAFVAYKLTVSPSGNPNKLVKVSNIDGKGTDLRLLAHGFLQNIKAAPFTDDYQKQYLAITDIDPKGRTVRFTGRYGRYGQSGSNVIDIQTGDSIHELGDKDAFTNEVRNMIVVPEGSEIALFLAERYAGRGLATTFLRELGRAFRQKFKTERYILRSEGLTNGEAWKNFLANAQLSQVRVIRHRVASDIADEPNQKHLYNLTYSAKPASGLKYFPRKVADGLLDGSIKPQDILGLDIDMNIDETRLEMKGADWQKDFALDQDAPVLIYPVNTQGDNRPSDDQIYERMEEVVTELCPTLSVDLSAGWQYGTWSSDALTVTMEALRGS